MPDRTAPKLGGGRWNPRPAAFEAKFNMPLVHETVRAELNARRRGTAATLTRGKVRGGGAKPWRQKGTGRARRVRSALPISPAAESSSAPPPATTPSRSTARLGGRRCAAPSRRTPSTSRWPCSTPPSSTSRRPARLSSCSTTGAWRGTVVVILSPDEAAAGKSFRNIAGVDVMPVGDVGVADIVGATRCSYPRRRSPSWWPARVAPPATTTAARRRRPDGSQPGDHPPRRIRKDLRARRGRQVHLPRSRRAHKTQIRQAIEQLFDVKVVGIRTMSVKSKPKRRGQTAGRTRQWKKAMVQVREGDTIPIFRGLEGSE